MDNVPENKTITGEHLVSLRERLGMNQDEMANIMGVHKVTYCKYETNKYPITATNAKFIKLMMFTPDDVIKSLYDA